MTDEEMAAAIARALEPLAIIAESHKLFEHAYDEVHLRLMKLFDKAFNDGLYAGMHAAVDELEMRHVP